MVAGDDAQVASIAEARVWNWLSQVPDPELPFLTITDLGIVREVNQNSETTEVILTPTYSGCPATAVITLSVEEALARQGLDNFKVSQRIAPPWTTDWITEEGKAKLKENGITPPDRGAPCSGMVAEGPVECPRCRSTETVSVSFFGSTPCKAAYQCKACLEPFDYFKPF